MRRLKLVLAASAGLLLAAGIGGADAAMPANAGPSAHGHAVKTVRGHHPPPGYHYYSNHRWWKHRKMMHHHWHYY